MKIKALWILLVLSLLLTACGSGSDSNGTAIAQYVAGTLTAMPTDTPSLTSTPSHTPTFTLTYTPSLTETATFTPTFTLTATRSLAPYLPKNTNTPEPPSNSSSCTQLTCQTIDLSQFGGSCTVVCVDSCGNTTTSSCGG